MLTFFLSYLSTLSEKKVFTFNTGNWDLIVLFQELKQVVQDESCNEVPLIKRNHRTTVLTRV